MNAQNKPIFDGLLHTGKPDLEALYRMGKIPMIHRTGYPGWTDPLGLPTAQWYDSVTSAGGAQAPRNIVLIDHEDWPYGTQAERQATAAKYVTIYQEIKARKPQWRIGWYQDPVRKDFYKAVSGVGSSDYKVWQSWNNDLSQVLAPYTDIYMPSLYWMFLRASASHLIPHLTTYLEENLNEVKRVRRVYGRMESPIYPYIQPFEQQSGVPLDADVWATIVQVVMEQADGCVLWAGALPWDENAPWWVTIKARLTDKRRTQ